MVCTGEEGDVRRFFVWIIEFLKLLVGRRLHPLTTQCPVCQQMVRLHVNKAGRRHVFAHTRALYEGSQFSAHYSAKLKCGGSGRVKLFDPRPDEDLRFKLPNSLLDE
jgi:hypothetical protein